MTVVTHQWSQLKKYFSGRKRNQFGCGVITCPAVSYNTTISSDNEKSYLMDTGDAQATVQITSTAPRVNTVFRFPNLPDPCINVTDAVLRFDAVSPSTGDGPATLIVWIEDTVNAFSPTTVLNWNDFNWYTKKQATQITMDPVIATYELDITFLLNEIIGCEITALEVAGINLGVEGSSGPAYDLRPDNVEIEIDYYG